MSFERNQLWWLLEVKRFRLPVENQEQNELGQLVKEGDSVRNKPDILL